MTTPTPKLTHEQLAAAAKAARENRLKRHYPNGEWSQPQGTNEEKAVADWQDDVRAAVAALGFAVEEPPKPKTRGEEIAEKVFRIVDGDHIAIGNEHYVLYWLNDQRYRNAHCGHVKAAERMGELRVWLARIIDAALAERDGEIRAAREVARLAADSIQWGHETRDALEGVLRGIAQWDAPAILNAKGGSK